MMNAAYDWYVTADASYRLPARRARLDPKSNGAGRRWKDFISSPGTALRRS
jgi:hypothetical protein